MSEEKQQQAMAMVIMGTVGLEKEKYRLGHTKVILWTYSLPISIGSSKSWEEERSLRYQSKVLKRNISKEPRSWDNRDELILTVRSVSLPNINRKFQKFRDQGCINRWILQSGIGARRASSEHAKNMELRCALVIRATCSVSQSTVLCVSEPILNKDIHCMFVEGKSRTVFFLQTHLFTAFLTTAQKIITYVLVSTWHEVSSGWEHVPRLM